MPAPVVFLALARFRGIALYHAGGIALVAAAGFLLGNLSLFRFADFRVGESVGARAALVFSQRPQHDAGRL